MENYIERIDQLTERWLDGATTYAEERELQRLVKECGAALPARLGWLADTFEGYRALAEERNPQPTKRPQRTHRAPLITLQRIATWSLAAAAVVVAIIGFSIDHEPYCYVNGEAVYDAQLAMNETACLDYLSELDQVMNVLTILEN